MKRSQRKSRSKRFFSVIGKIFATIGITIAFLALLCLGAIFVLEKGPSETAKVIFVNSCDESSAMKWLPHIFLKDAEIQKILDSSKMTEVDEGTTSDSSKINVSEDVSNEIELVDIVGGSYRGKMLIIHDPKRVFLGHVESFGEFQGLTVLGIADRYEGVIGGVNGGDFVDGGSYAYTAQPLGCIVSSEGNRDCAPEDLFVYNQSGMDSIYHISGFTKEGKFFIGNVSLNDAIYKYGVIDAVYTVHNTGPFLVMNGEALIDEVPDSAVYGGGKNPRTAIGQRADGAVLLLVVDGRQTDSLGATFKDLAYEMLKQGAINAAAMDGGTSTQMVWEGEIINHPYSPTGPRRCPTAWLVK